MFAIRNEVWGPTLPSELPSAVVLGNGDDGPVTLDLNLLLSGRLLIQGPSGSGKTTLLRRLISQCAPHVQWIAIDPEGEHSASNPLKISKPLPPQLVVQGANKIRYSRQSYLIDISELKREHQLVYLSQFVYALVEAPRELWHNRCLLIIDESEIYCPTDTSVFDDRNVGKRSRSALVELMTRGRKRGLIGCVATHRLAQLAPSVRAEARNLLIGGSSFDVDIHRAAECLGWNAAKAFAIIPHLPTGCFVAVGPAFSKSPTIVRIPRP